MMHTARNRGIRCGLFALAVLGTQAAWAADPAPVGVQSGGSSIYLSINAPYAKAQLSVAGPGVYWQHRYGPGDAVEFYPGSVSGGLPDGQYNYQLVASPEYDAAAWAAVEGDEATTLANASLPQPRRRRLSNTRAVSPWWAASFSLTTANRKPERRRSPSWDSLGNTRWATQRRAELEANPSIGEEVC